MKTFPLTTVQQDEATLTINQLNTPARQDIANLFYWALSCTPVAAITYLGGRFVLPATPDFQAHFITGLLIISLPWWFLLLRAITELFGRETFVFDKTHDTFIRNGSPIGPLKMVKSAKAQVNRGLTQNARYRLILEMLGAEPIVVVMTHYIPTPQEHSQCFYLFTNTDKQIATFASWIDYDKQVNRQNIPAEILELQQQINGFVRAKAAL